MDQELEILIKQRYKILPDDIKRTIATLPIQEIMQDISLKNGLHIDQAGILYTEAMLIMLGVEKINSFRNNIESRLHIPSSLAENLVNDINQKIFLSIRESLQQMEELHEAGESSEISREDINRDQILNEIENPTDTIHPISAAREIGAAEPLEILPETTETHETIAKDFVAGKLTETVSLPSQRTEISSQKTIEQPKSKPKNYSADPYREPIS